MALPVILFMAIHRSDASKSAIDFMDGFWVQ